VPLEQEEPESIDYAALQLDPVPTPHETYECRERVERLEATAVRELTPEQRLLFELHHLRHHPITDLAALLEKSEDAVKSNLYRARRVLLAR
jgi:RNA polymerase sigma factor (sigma-70 family)